MQTPARSATKLLLGLLSASAMLGHLSAAPTAAYPQPQPSSREQYLLELINAARANPAGEGQMLASVTDSEIQRYYSYYKVDLGGVKSAFNSYAAKPPLAFNANLMNSALAQSSYQAKAGVQSHNSADGSTFDKRITAAGYKWGAIGENVYAYANDPFFGHVGLNVDWGVPSLDHRDNIMNLVAGIPTYREIGISCVDTSIKDFGPLVITQDFGTPADATLAYVTGVVYQDLNGNGSYDEGEGLGGVTVSPDAGNYYAVTTASGGYLLPLPTSGAGSLSLTASGGNLGATKFKTVAYTAGTNVKADFTPADAGAALPVVALSSTSKDLFVGMGPSQVVVTRSGGDVSKQLKVRMNYGGDAIVGVDCNTLPKKVVIPAGQSSVAFDVHSANAISGGAVTLKMNIKPKKTYVVDGDSKQVNSKVRLWPKS